MTSLRTLHSRTCPRGSLSVSISARLSGLRAKPTLVGSIWCRRNAGFQGRLKAVIEQMAIVGYKELNECGEFDIPGFVKVSVVKPATEACSGVNPFTKE